MFDQNFRGDVRDNAQVGLLGCGWVVWCVVALLVFGAVGFGWWYITYPLAVQRETYAAHQSYGYTTTQQTQLITWMQDYERHQTEIDAIKDDPSKADIVTDLQNQQVADLNQMHAKISLMEKTQVPPDVAQFLAEHGG